MPGRKDGQRQLLPSAAKKQQMRLVPPQSPYGRNSCSKNAYPQRQHKILPFVSLRRPPERRLQCSDHCWRNHDTRALGQPVRNSPADQDLHLLTLCTNFSHVANPLMTLSRPHQRRCFFALKWTHCDCTGGRCPAPLCLPRCACPPSGKGMRA